MLGEWTEDSIIDVLMNLPVKSLLRFKSVAKSWCALFETPHFICSHLNIKKHSRLLVNHLHREEGPGGRFTMKKKLFLDETLEDISHIPIDLAQLFPGEVSSDGFDAGSFCVNDGLFCFSPRPFEQVYLCNIATRDLLLLPQLPKPQGISRSQADRVVAIGFQADFSSNSYKVFFCREFSAYTRIPSIVQFSVYSSSTGSWRECKLEPYNFPSGGDGSGLIDGIYYWVGRDILHHNLFILTFHLDDEVFKEMQGPPISSYAEEEIVDYNIFKHQNHVWLGIMYGRDLSYVWPEPPKFIDLWVMNDDGHWTKQLKIGPLSGIRQILKFWKNGWILLSDRGVLLLYDPCTEEMRNLGIDMARGIFPIAVYAYEESLVKTRFWPIRF